MGAAVMFIGMDDDAGPQLYKCDPAGHFVGYKVSIKKKYNNKESFQLQYHEPWDPHKDIEFAHIDSVTKHMRITLFRVITNVHI